MIFLILTRETFIYVKISTYRSLTSAKYIYAFFVTPQWDRKYEKILLFFKRQFVFPHRNENCVWIFFWNINFTRLSKKNCPVSTFNVMNQTMNIFDKGYEKPNPSTVFKEGIRQFSQISNYNTRYIKVLPIHKGV